MVSEVNELARVGVRHEEIPTFYDGEELHLRWKSGHMVFDDSPKANTLIRQTIYGDDQRLYYSE